ncbi:hypothetical protein JYK22_21665, partial [Nonomuraea sp. RK-328]|nr:hypothetical protein [Nonomuraea sp. RK-328]
VKWLLLILLSVPEVLLSAWALMLLFGVAHHEVSSAIPPIGYGSALLVSLAFGWWNAIRRAFQGAAEEVVK